MPKYIVSYSFENIIKADDTEEIEDEKVENQTKGRIS